jgi:hypothetical protein
LLRQLGEGGCGQVCLAEPDKPMHRQVAWQIIKLGGEAHPKAIARCEAEFLNHLGNSLAEQGKFTEAASAHREALAFRGRFSTNNAPELAFSLDNLAVCSPGKRTTRCWLGSGCGEVRLSVFGPAAWVSASTWVAPGRPPHPFWRWTRTTSGGNLRHRKFCRP